MAVSTPTADEFAGALGDLAKEKSRLERLLGPDFYRMLRGVVTNPLSVAGITILTIFALVAILAPTLAPPLHASRPYSIPRDGFSPNPRPPGAEWTRNPPPPAFWLKPLTGSDQWIHVMGTASGQWDIFYGVVWGTRTAFKVGLIITAITCVFGIIVGTVSAFYGGFVDMILMRITDVVIMFPFLLAAITLSAILTPKFGRGIWPPTIALIFFGWTGYARLVRSEILALKEREYITAARVIGAKDSRIMFRHILPNAIFPTLVMASMRIGSYVISFAALSFLGVGVEVGYADWGQLLSFARDWMTQLGQYWYMVIFPGTAMVLFVLAWNLLGDALRDILDPRLRGRGGI
jgi:peptide/nickel transport system permease protein